MKKVESTTLSLDEDGSSSAAPDHGLSLFKTFSEGQFEGENFGPFGNQDMGSKHYLLRPIRNSSPATGFGENPFVFFDSETSKNGVASNSEMGSFGDKKYPQNSHLVV